LPQEKQAPTNDLSSGKNLLRQRRWQSSTKSQACVAWDSRIERPAGSAPRACGLMNPSGNVYQQIGIYQPKRGTIFGKIGNRSVIIWLLMAANSPEMTLTMRNFGISIVLQK
jgi:hypothetical protein